MIYNNILHTAALGALSFFLSVFCTSIKLFEKYFCKITKFRTYKGVFHIAVLLLLLKAVNNVLLPTLRLIFIIVYTIRGGLCSYRQAHKCVHADTHKHTRQAGKWELLNHITVTAIMTDGCIIWERKSLSLLTCVFWGLITLRLTGSLLTFLYWGQKATF